MRPVAQESLAALFIAWELSIDKAVQHGFDHVHNIPGRTTPGAMWEEFCSVFIPALRDFASRRLFLLPMNMQSEVRHLVVLALHALDMIFARDLEAATASIDKAKAMYMAVSGQLALMEEGMLPRRPSCSPPLRFRGGAEATTAAGSRSGTLKRERAPSPKRGFGKTRRTRADAFRK